MARAPFQVLVIPYRTQGSRLFFALFRRREGDVWQGIAGGGEIGESVAEAARREAWEEARIPKAARLVPLDTRSSIRADCFAASAQWGQDVHVVPEYAFGLAAHRADLTLCSEHASYAWLTAEAAIDRATFDGNSTAIWELDRRLRREAAAR